MDHDEIVTPDMYLAVQRAINYDISAMQKRLDQLVELRDWLQSGSKGSAWHLAADRDHSSPEQRS